MYGYNRVADGGGLDVENAGPNLHIRASPRVRAQRAAAGLRKASDNIGYFDLLHAEDVKVHALIYVRSILLLN